MTTARHHLLPPGIAGETQLSGIKACARGTAGARAPLCEDRLCCHGNLHHCNHGDGGQGSGGEKSITGVMTAQTSVCVHLLHAQLH